MPVWPEERAMENVDSYDVVIVGAGPAGLQAAIHASRKKVSVLVLGKEHKSSLFRAHVENMVSLFNATGKTMLKHGILKGGQKFYIGACHTDADVSETVKIFEAVAEALRSD